MINEGLEKEKTCDCNCCRKHFRCKRICQRIRRTYSPASNCYSFRTCSRGGTPTAFDRVLATRMGSHAIQLILENKYNKIVAIKGNKIVDVDLEKIKKSETKIQMIYLE